MNQNTAPTAEEARACPYNCGALNPPWVMSDEIPRHYVQCDGCGARGPRCQTKRQALTEWNAAAQQSTTPSASNEQREAIGDPASAVRDVLCDLVKPELAEEWDAISAAADAILALTNTSQDHADAGKAGEDEQRNLGPNAKVFEDERENGFMSVSLAVGENVYIAQSDSLIVISREVADQLGRALTEQNQ